MKSTKRNERLTLQDVNAQSLIESYIPDCSQVFLPFDDNTDQFSYQVSEASSETFEELNEKWTPKKEASQILATKLYDLSHKSGYSLLRRRADKIDQCGSFLQFRYPIDNAGNVSDQGKLFFANFCKDRLCPICNWRRSMKIYANLSKILTSEKIVGNYKFLMITLTIPNVFFSDLDAGIETLQSGFTRLMKKPVMKKVVLGYFKSLEITVNLRTGTFHPHLHILVAVPLSYGKKDSLYISHDELLHLWRESVKNPNITQVDIRLIKPKKGSGDSIQDAIKEVAKYSVKAGDYKKLTDEAILGLIDGIANRRLVSLGGVFKKASRLLNLQDVESEGADLVHMSDELDEVSAYLIRSYHWTFSAYRLTDEFVNEVIA